MKFKSLFNSISGRIFLILYILLIIFSLFIAINSSRKIIFYPIVILVYTILFIIYFMPFIISIYKNKNNLTAILIINLLIGWTIFGWIILLIYIIIKKKVIIIFSIIFLIIILLLLYSFNNHFLSYRERNLRNKMFEEIDRINYCNVKEDCTVGCIWDVSTIGCGTPYFYNVDESDERVERYRSKISNLMKRQGKDNYQINCIANMCEVVLMNKLYDCKENICVRSN